jgi:hypothetical protein
MNYKNQQRHGMVLRGDRQQLGSEDCL